MAQWHGAASVIVSGQAHCRPGCTRAPTEWQQPAIPFTGNRHHWQSSISASGLGSYEEYFRVKFKFSTHNCPVRTYHATHWHPPTHPHCAHCGTHTSAARAHAHARTRARAPSLCPDKISDKSGTGSGSLRVTGSSLRLLVCSLRTVTGTGVSAPCQSVPSQSPAY